MQMKQRQTLTLALALSFLLFPLSLFLFPSLALSLSVSLSLCLSAPISPEAVLHMGRCYILHGAAWHILINWRAAHATCHMQHATIAKRAVSPTLPPVCPSLPPSLHNCQPMFAVVVVAGANPRLLHTDTCVKPHCQRAICRPSAGRVDRQYLP